MPLTEAQKRANKKYKEANKEKIKEQRRKYRQANKEKAKEYRKKWKEENKETEKEYSKKYYIENKQKIIKYGNEYQKTENGKKNRFIHNWINKHKIKFDDRNEAEFYYNSYINTHRCTWCDKMFKDSKDRQFDHCHTCGLPRAIICRECNVRDVVPCVSCLL